MEIITINIQEKFSSTIDSFWIVLNPGVIINPFDFVSIDDKSNIKTIRIVEELQRIFIRFDSNYNNFTFSFDENFTTTNANIQWTGATIAKIVIMANLYNNNFQERSTDDIYNVDTKIILKKGSDLSINMPIEEGKPAVFACIDEII